MPLKATKELSSRSQTTTEITTFCAWKMVWMVKHGEANYDHRRSWMNFGWFFVLRHNQCSNDAHVGSFARLDPMCPTRRYRNKSLEHDVPPYSGCTLGCMYLQTRHWTLALALKRSLCGYDMILTIWQETIILPVFPMWMPKLIIIIIIIIIFCVYFCFWATGHFSIVKHIAVWNYIKYTAASIQKRNKHQSCIVATWWCCMSPSLLYLVV